MSAPAEFPTSQVYPWILPHAPGVTNAAMDREIVTAADKILRRTRLWNVQLAPFYPDGVNDTFDIVQPTNYSQVCKLWGWSLNGVRRRTYTQEQAMNAGLEPSFYDTDTFFDGADGGSDGVLLSPVAFLPNENQVTVLPLQTDTAQPIVLRVGFTIKPGGTTLPGVLAPYVQLLAEGALSRLQATPKKDYTDLGQAGVNEDRFNTGVGRLALRATRAFGAGTVRRRPRTY